MSVRFLIIDGYNLLHDAGLARATYGPGDLARQRHLLLTNLANRLTTEERRRCTVVFDAIDAPPNLPGRHKHQGIEVQFAKPGHEADELIETLIIQHTAARNLTVVSSDHRLQNAIRRRRGTALDSDIFLAQLRSQKPQPGPEHQMISDVNNPKPDLEFWVKEFNQIDVEHLEKEAVELSGETRSDWDDQVVDLEQRLQNSDELDAWLNETPTKRMTGNPRPRPPS